MNEILNPTNLVLAGIAAIVFWRLWSVLGTRTGHERPPMDLSSPMPGPAKDRASVGTGDTPPRGPEPLEARPVWADVAPEGSPLAQSLQQIADAARGFDARHFLSGARTAYEMVVEAFASGDKPALKNLLSADVYDGFGKAIDARKAANQKLDFRFIGFDKAEITKAEMEGKRAIITVKFASQFISATYDSDQKLIEGDPNAVRTETDLWSFERDVSQANPNWRVVSTEQLG